MDNHCNIIGLGLGWDILPESISRPHPSFYSNSLFGYNQIINLPISKRITYKHKWVGV